MSKFKNHSSQKSLPAKDTQKNSPNRVISYDSHAEKRLNDQVTRSTIVRASMLKW
jgi:hypothetical protein